MLKWSEEKCKNLKWKDLSRTNLAKKRVSSYKESEIEEKIVKLMLKWSQEKCKNLKWKYLSTTNLAKKKSKQLQRKLNKGENREINAEMKPREVLKHDVHNTVPLKTGTKRESWPWTVPPRPTLCKTCEERVIEKEWRKRKKEEEIDMTCETRTQKTGKEREKYV